MRDRNNLCSQSAKELLEEHAPSFIQRVIDDVKLLEAAEAEKAAFLAAEAARDH